MMDADDDGCRYHMTPPSCSSSPSQSFRSPMNNNKSENFLMSRSDRNCDLDRKRWQNKNIIANKKSWITIFIFAVKLCLLLIVVPPGVESFVLDVRNGNSHTGTFTTTFSGRVRISYKKTVNSKNNNNKVQATDDGYDGLGEYDPSERLRPQREVLVGDPQIRVKETERSVMSILKELAAIQQQGPQKYCILGTRHCSYLHQQIIELLAYALVLSGNHVYTSGAGGTNAAAIKGALRAEQDDLLTVVLPQSMSKQTKESQELLKEVKNVETMPQNDDMPLDVASRICNSYLLSQTDQLISFAFHESTTVIEATKEAKELEMLVTTLYLD